LPEGASAQRQHDRARHDCALHVTSVESDVEHSRFKALDPGGIWKPKMLSPTARRRPVEQIGLAAPRLPATGSRKAPLWRRPAPDQRRKGMRNGMYRRALFASFVVWAGAAAGVHAETTLCTDVATLAAAPPYVIAAHGVYCLKADVMYTAPFGAAITIATNNVVLDLNAHKIGGGGAKPSGGGRRGVAGNQRNRSGHTRQTC